MAAGGDFRNTESDGVKTTVTGNATVGINGWPVGTSPVGIVVGLEGHVSVNNTKVFMNTVGKRLWICLYSWYRR